MCLEARLLHWLAWPGSLSDSSRVLNRSTPLMWALTEGVWNNMVDSMSLLGFNTTSSLLLFKGRKCLVFHFSWSTFCLIAFSTMEDLLYFTVLCLKVYLPIGTVCITCVSEWIVLQVSFQLIVDTLSATFQNSVSDSLELLPCLLMLISILVCSAIFTSPLCMWNILMQTSYTINFGQCHFFFQSCFVSSSSDTKVTSRVSHGSYSTSISRVS